ncbi:hypothetical protein [Maridesulfovibrio bastinii]|uniref:hypothetical protein n=1 Tax=Maridesulfovibrio bastinii TaxID=47157 RepID=UPI000415DAB7|nr:hypothetical protein [Maridesulfovibrio bastinii]
MTDILFKASSNNDCGMVRFICKDNVNEPFPCDYSDPLALLGDIRILDLDESQKNELRQILSSEVKEQGPEEIWRNRTFRKNIILSFGKIV